MSLSNDILTTLFGGYSASYKAMWRIINGDTRPRRSNTQVKQSTLYITIARLKKNGLIAKHGDTFKITSKGKEFYNKRRLLSLPSHFKSASVNTDNGEFIRKNMIIAFDIPEHYRRKRDWLRIDLTMLGFAPIQKSVWFGPAPLPRSFIKNLDDLKILAYLKFFKAEEQEIV